MASYEPVELAYCLMEPDDHVKYKTPILFLHGLTESKEHWNDIPQTIANATKRKVFLIDARNHGDSPWSDVFNFDCNVDDLLHFMHKMNIPTAILVGHSMGGVTGIKTALRAPERVERLVVEDIGARKLPQSKLDFVLAYMNLLKAAIEEVPADVDEDTAIKCIAAFTLKNLPPESAKPIKEDATEYRIQLKRTPDGRYRFKSNMNAFIKALQSPADLMAEPEGLYEGPVSFIYGKISPNQVGSDQEYNRKFFPNIEFVGIENATHSVHADCPCEFTEALLNFLLRE